MKCAFKHIYSMLSLPFNMQRAYCVEWNSIRFDSIWMCNCVLTMQINNFFRFANRILSDAFVCTKIIWILRSYNQSHCYTIDVINGHWFVCTAFPFRDHFTKRVGNDGKVFNSRTTRKVKKTVEKGAKRWTKGRVWFSSLFFLNWKNYKEKFDIGRYLPCTKSLPCNQ